MIATAASHDRIEMFQKNLHCLPNYLQKQLQEIHLQEVWERIDIVYSKDGNPICVCKENGKRRYINSKNPQEQAKYWCAHLPLDRMGTLLVYGCGFGYALFELLVKVRKDCKIIVSEQNIYLFTAMLHFFDVEPIMRSGQFIFFIGDVEDFSQDFLKLIATSNMVYFTAPSIVFTPGIRMFRQKYLEIQRHIFEQLIQQIGASGNDHSDSLVGFHNMIANVGEVLENPYLSRLKDKFKNVPAFIVANGPSLDKNIQELKQVKGKGLIFCCESAIVPLVKNDIKPDAIFVLERNPESYLYHFQTKYPEDVALLALAVVDSRIFASFAGPKIPIFRSLESSYQWLNQIVGDGSALFGGTNVAHLAYETAVYMGANPIVLVGQDLAFGPDGVTHSRQSKYADDMPEHIEEIQELSVVYVEGNDGSFIPSVQGWIDIRKGLERMIEQIPYATVINATEGGAKVKGAVNAKLTNVVGTYCKDPLPYRLDSWMNEHTKKIAGSAKKDRIKSLEIELEKGIRIYRALEQSTSQRRKECEQLLNALEHKKYADVKQELSWAFEHNFREIMSFMSPHLQPSYFQQVILFGYHQMNQLGAVNSPKKLREALQIQFEVFDYLSIICQSLARNFKIAAEQVSSQE